MYIKKQRRSPDEELHYQAIIKETRNSRRRVKDKARYARYKAAVLAGEKIPYLCHAPSGEYVHDKYGLKPKDHQIIRLISEGKSNKGMASDMGMNEGNIEALRVKLYHKTGSPTPGALVRWAFDQGILKPKISLLEFDTTVLRD